jgi:hypothetical protein
MSDYIGAPILYPEALPESVKSRSLPPWLPPLAAGFALAAVFIALNHRAYDGYFQDDDLDTLTWAPYLRYRAWLVGLITPAFSPDNFRPAGHLFYKLMGTSFGLNFPPWMTPVFAIHLLNGLLLFLLMKRLGISQWCALAGVAFFTLSTAAFDAYWKPMYIFDLLCTTLSLASILFYASRRWVLSFFAFWLAYKAKELAVMLPAVLVLYEYWFGGRRFRVLIPFLLVSLSFGIQGLVLNPNKDNDYTFRFSLDALRHTIPFYSTRFLMVPFSGLALFALALVKDRRIWFALAAMSAFIVTLLFLPGRLFEAYLYLPLAFAAIALAAAAAHVNPVWAWIALAVWMPFNMRQLRHERNEKLARDDQAFAFVSEVLNWTAHNPGTSTFVYDGAPDGFHFWGVTAAWEIAHHTAGPLPVWPASQPEGRKALATERVAFGVWDREKRELVIRVRTAGE